ncbi:hypothetical protein BSZ35_11115 [Salinibacter sp. 10B]|uniref:sulfotransferase family protein n=1 Tax=Salinibacter sp. 10B TaxID=1923971 RepID=UPI000CF4FEF3|nr:sulfotransferase [Salinibacter sp. 10B]PQJ35071.1 hypothetical protein BSZ35_11115 [Salinibacter sp. 10B]
MKPPVFLVGSPRSGTTITLQLLAAHEELGWISQHQHVRPEVPAISTLNRLYDLPGLGDSLYYEVTQGRKCFPEKIRYYLPEPVEPWGFWGHHLEDFLWDRDGEDPPRRRTPEDVDSREIDCVRDTVQAVLRYQGKPRLLSKYTDFPRIRYLKRVFPDAVFVHVRRDGRAAAASYHRKLVTGAFERAWEKREWWIEGWPEPWQNVWRTRYEDPLTFAAFQWGTFVRGIVEEATHLEKQCFCEVRYEDIMTNPERSLEDILGSIGLKKSPSMASFIERVELESRNHKWRERYSPAEKERLEKCVQICLQDL